MSYKSPPSPSYPIFPMPEPHHFSDYGFDTQFDYFQVLEEARNHKREAAGAAESSAGSILDSLQFKPQKSISSSSDKSSASYIDAGPQKTSSKKNKKPRHWHWWNKAFLIFSCGSSLSSSRPQNHIFADDDDEDEDERDVHHARARAFRASSVSGTELYMADSAAGTPQQARSRPSSGPLGLGFVSSGRKTGGGSPYLSLRELNLERQQHLHRMSASSSPIYLVT